MSPGWSAAIASSAKHGRADQVKISGRQGVEGCDELLDLGAHKGCGKRLVLSMLMSPLFRQVAQFCDRLDVAFGDQAESKLAARCPINVIAQHLKGLVNYIDELDITRCDGH